MHHHSIVLLLIFNLFFPLIQGQQLQAQSYREISGLFDAYSENDKRALVFVNLYISKAKKEHNLKKLIEGFEEAIYYNEEVNRKLSYADSTIITALQLKDSNEIARAYLGKGIIHYYNRRQYKQALELYLTAFKFSKDSEDQYLKNKIIYHLGMVKSYLGYYKEAALHFEEAANYFKRNLENDLHPNIRLNNESGYFNSIYRLSTCYKNLQLFHKEDSLINIGLEKLHNTNEFSLEYAYFKTGKGIQFLRNGNTDESLKYLNLSKEILNQNQDYASLTTTYFYIGKLYWAMKNREKSLQYFNKVDSLVNKFWLITPEIRSNYEFLINDAKQKQNSERQLYYTNQLLKADSIINADFAMLSSKIYHEYDTNTLLEEKKQLVKVHSRRLIFFYYSIGFAFLIICFSIWIFRKKKMELNDKYQKLLRKFNNVNNTENSLEFKPVFSEEKSIYSVKIIDEVKLNLKIFEQKKQFLKQNLTLSIVAKMIGSNRTHLSYVLNEHLHLTFPMYLKILRIEYITNSLLQNNKYLNYTIDSLATECGMANRQIFSTHFLEINGMRPTDFIRKRQEELSKV